MKHFNRKQMEYLNKVGYEFAINSHREYARLFISPAGFTALCLDICNRVYDPPITPSPFDLSSWSVSTICIDYVQNEITVSTDLKNGHNSITQQAVKMLTNPDDPAWEYFGLGGDENDL